MKSVTRPAWRSFRRLHTWCLEQGSNPAVGSSKSNTCEGEQDQTSTCPRHHFHACIISFHTFYNLTLRIKYILRYQPFLLLFLLLQYYYPFYLNMVLVDLDSLILPAAKWISRSADLEFQGKSTSMPSQNAKLCAKAVCGGCGVCKYDQPLPGDSLKLQFLETISVFVPHSEYWRGRPEGR